MAYQSWGCKECGKEAPERLRKHGQFGQRMTWLRRHRKKYHPEQFRESIEKGVATRLSR
jgi:hypothetical protein